MRIYLFLIIIGLTLAACQDQKQSVATSFPAGEWIDLTYAVDEQTVYWPTAAGFCLDTVFMGETDKGYFYEQNIPGFENIANMEQLPVKGSTVIALPMKIRGGSGGPLRIVALVGDSEE